MINNRIQNTFQNLKKSKKKALITFVTGCDPDYNTSQKILKELVKQGSDLLEIGMPFSDPMADGPSIQKSSLRALSAKTNMKKIFRLVSDFRKKNKVTPIVLMGYLNPILSFGIQKFFKSAKSAGTDGLIVVDVPPEEDDEISDSGKQYFVEITLDSENALLGKSFISGLLPDLKDATINLIIRDNEKILPPFDDIILETKDRLIIAITKNELIQKIKSNDKIFDKIGYENDKSDRELIIEAAVSPRSFMIGRTINQTNFETETNCKVIGLQRERKFDRDSPRSQKLSQENILLIRGDEELIRRLRAHKDIFPIEWSAIALPLKKFSQRSRIIFAVTIISAATGFLNITTAALLGAVMMLIFKVLSIKEALSSLDIKIYLLVASTLMLSTVLQETGGAKLIADTLILLTNNLSIPSVLSLLFIIIAIITNFLSNNATAVLFTPIAINLANDFQMQPEPFIFCVIFAANCSFATPIGYQTNLMVMGPGGYKFVDYLKSGIPLIIILWITYSLTVYFGI